MPDNEQLVSSEENPEPVTEMVVPGRAYSLGLSVICCEATVKHVVASPVSPPFVVAVIGQGVPVEVPADIENVPGPKIPADIAQV
jgi:hypothetical protein